MTPADGGKPEAIATPRLNGNAIKNTKKPERKSTRQFSFRLAVLFCPEFNELRKSIILLNGYEQ
jgi:hypothetical protein